MSLTPEKQQSMNDFLKLDFNERSDSPNPLIEKNQFEQSLWCYPQREQLETIIAEKNGLQSEQVICTNGGDEAIYLLMRMLKESGQLILPLPAFSQYLWGIKSWSLDPLLVSANDDLTIDLSATLSAVENSTKATLVITRPNNPTGEFITEEQLRKLLDASKNSQGWVFLDEAYIEFSQLEAISVGLLNEYSNLVILRTLSKAYGLAGIRLGYLLGAEPLINQFKQRAMPFNISQPTLTIAQKALENSRDSEVKNYCQKIIENRTKIIELVQSSGVSVTPSKANFILLSMAVNRAKAVASFLKKNKILVKVFIEPELEHCIRIGIPYDLKNLPECLSQALNPKLICMDMDGVLIDTTQSYDNAIIETVLKLSGQLVTIEAIQNLRRQGGFNNDWVLSKKLLDDLGVNQLLEKVTEIFQTIYLGEDSNGLISNENPLIKTALVEKINQPSTQQFAIVTGRPLAEAKLGASLVKLEQLPLMSLDDVVEGKPSPEGIKKLQQQYGDSSWMCGDNPDDMQAATGSNSMAIGIGLENKDALYQAGADIVVDNINEISGWLK